MSFTESIVEAVYAEEHVWLSQKMMGLLYDVDVRTISYHLKNVFADHELEESSVIQFFRITAADGKTYDTGPGHAVGHERSARRLNSHPRRSAKTAA